MFYNILRFQWSLNLSRSKLNIQKLKFSRIGTSKFFIVELEEQFSTAFSEYFIFNTFSVEWIP